MAHHALRCMAVDCGYEPLWREQLGDAWREPGKAPFSWPVLAGDDERWAVRAAIDAVVADAYGLSREQYAHVLSTFRHASYKKAPDLCMAAFDQLKAIGLDTFCKNHDPYHDILLVETLPKPVIDLPIPAADGGDEPHLWQERDGQLTRNAPGPLFENTTPRRAKRSKTSAAGETIDPAKLAAAKTLLELKKVVSNDDIQDQLSLAPSQARAILKHLAELGFAKVEGKARGTRYRLK